jgi:hypothetical protein
MTVLGETSSEVVVTGVDALIDLLKKINQIDVPDAAKKLKYPIETVQSWVDFLVEEKMIGIEYNLTTPRIFLLNQGNAKKDKQVDLGKEFGEIKQDISHARKDSKAEFDWKNHISYKLETMKPFFITEAQKRELKDIGKLWEEYKQKTLTT